MKNSKENKETTASTLAKNKEAENIQESPINERTEEEPKEIIKEKPIDNAKEQPTEKAKAQQAGNAKVQQADNEKEQQLGDVEKEAVPSPPSLDEMTETACNALNSHEGINEGEAARIGKFLHSVISDIQSGIISKNTIETLLLAIRHDADVESALREGEVKGRNAKIDEWKEQRRGMANVHQLGNASSALHAHVSPARIGGLSAADRQTIWERGNEKRVRY